MNIETYPITSISIEQAEKKQFELVDCICREFSGLEILELGDLGVKSPFNKPETTLKAERVLARFFNTESAVLVRGAGTGALRLSFSSCSTKKRKALVHSSPLYPTTETTFEMMQIDPVYVDFHDQSACDEACQSTDLDFILVQTTRQKLSDHYDLETVIKGFKKACTLPIIVDDNYAVLKIDKIGVEYGADLSAFSAFKLLGPEGIGIVVGKNELCEKINRINYSGGSQVQGYEALEVLRGMTYAPVMLAIQAKVNDECVKRLNDHELPGIKSAFLANAQSKVLLVEFEKEIAERVLFFAQQLGAAPHPVGAESKYEITPMFYRVSGTFLKSDPSLKQRMIRINPMRSGASTVLRILSESVELALKEEGSCF
ncbi:MAG: hypothetical protein FD133_1324 [Erysipelotrichaceae bacterium]|nr:MAG: hypothetical protein FD179_1841 [Erysipelotrichaceae bacterium]TXT17562.1 MAG: hypothetical protein FD133_1324 [Erysipelotrichaceae bacterium]